MAYELPYTYETTEENPNKVTRKNFYTCDQNESYKEGFLIRGAGSGFIRYKVSIKHYEEEAVWVSAYSKRLRPWTLLYHRAIIKSNIRTIYNVTDVRVWIPAKMVWPSFIYL